MVPPPHRRLASLAAHVVASAPAASSAAEDVEARLAAMADERDALQLELARLTGPVPRSFFAAVTLEEAVEFFTVNGYWVFEDAVTGDWLARLQQKFTEASEPARALWHEAFAGGADQAQATPLHVPDLRGELKHAPGYFDIPRFAEYDDSMMHLLDNPAVVPMIEAVMGGKIQVQQIQGRTVPREAAGRYTNWHRDGGAEIDIHPSFSSSIKVFTFPFDVPADGGCKYTSNPLLLLVIPVVLLTVCLRLR